AYCTSCGDRLYGNETDDGVCTKCRTSYRPAGAPPPPRPEDDPSRAFGFDEPRRDSWADEPPSPRNWGGDEPYPYDPDDGSRGEWRTFRNGVHCVRSALIVHLCATLVGILV